MVKISKIGPARFFVASTVFMCSLFSLSLSATPVSRAALEADIGALLTQGKYTIQGKPFDNVEIIFVNPNCSSLSCNGQNSWWKGFRTIREAVEKPKTLTDGRLRVILVKNGTYDNISEGGATRYQAGNNAPVLMLDGNPNLVIIGGFVGSNTAFNIAEIGKLSPERSILDGRSSSYNVIDASFSYSPTPHYVEIRNFDIRRGCANFSKQINCFSAGSDLFIDEEVALQKVLLYGRRDTGFNPADNGGGMTVDASVGSWLRFSVRDSKFVGNKAFLWGGAMSFSLPSQYAKVSIVDSEFDDNHAGLGGAFSSGFGAKYEFHDNSFHNNEGVFGGGAYAAWENETHLGINNDFFGNSTKWDGGAVLVVRSRRFVIDNKMDDGRARSERERSSAYSSNKASGKESHGGAIYVRDAAGPVVITGPKIFQNKAAKGGGIAILGGRQEEQEEIAAAAPAALIGPIRLSSMWIANNEARSAGGGVHFENVPGTPLIERVEFLLNRVVTNDLHRAIINDLMQGLTLREDQERLLRDPAGEGGKGGGLYTIRTAVRILNSDFIRNGAGHGGGAHVEEGNAIFENVTFDKNNAFRWGGAIKLFERTKSIFREKLYVLRNTSLNGTGGIHARASELVFEGQATIDDNMAQKQAGGGITLNKGSKLIVSSGATLTLTKNVSGAETPDGGAGAIFATDNSSSVVGSIDGISCRGNNPPGTEGLAEKVASCEN